MEELNPPIIEDFRSNGGKVGGDFTSHNLLLLHTIGAKSQQPRVNPLCYIKDGDAFVIVGSKGGALTNPDWYYNILAHPEVELEVDTERFKARATIPEGEERDRLFASYLKQEPEIDGVQKATPRIFPVIRLTRM
ncbi:nitroreductase family deazaflavin-dependent oxidoreductase [Ktedonosporobacter rubrisoli]|uniref:Nitroreductase family deazaflavin-dependent oxidoreductase n=2 Tax=Ktedonosporobacter rubrisoli TaxID=2509675 RepID=A0A4P6K7S6_KTERU|nr:nitroreductase family deazaflavin-dependent oxidoreductase [Ktedonosporobacter rubrisoli]